MRTSEIRFKVLVDDAAYYYFLLRRHQCSSVHIAFIHPYRNFPALFTSGCKIKEAKRSYRANSYGNQDSSCLIDPDHLVVNVQYAQLVAIYIRNGYNFSLGEHSESRTTHRVWQSSVYDTGYKFNGKFQNRITKKFIKNYYIAVADLRMTPLE